MRFMIDAVPHRMSYVMYTLYATVFTPGLTAVRKKNKEREYIWTTNFVYLCYSSVPKFFGKRSLNFSLSFLLTSDGTSSLNPISSYRFYRNV